MQFLYLALVFIFLPNIAFAYIDPGSLSIILQVLGSFFVAILVFFRTIKFYLLEFYFKIFPAKKKKNNIKR